MIPIRADLTKFSNTVIGKAERVIAQGDIVQDSEHPEVWWVMSSDKRRKYRVQIGTDFEGTITYLTCACPHGLKKGGGNTFCYHAAAALLSIGEKEMKK